MSPDQRPPNSQDEFLTVYEVAALLRLNAQTIRNWIDAGQLPAVRIGRRVRVTRADLDRVMEAGYSSKAAPAPDGLKPALGFWDGDEDGPPEVENE
jgi:excisionase family DNA binding protein